MRYYLLALVASLLTAGAVVAARRPAWSVATGTLTGFLVGVAWLVQATGFRGERGPQLAAITLVVPCVLLGFLAGVGVRAIARRRRPSLADAGRR